MRRPDQIRETDRAVAQVPMTIYTAGQARIKPARNPYKMPKLQVRIGPDPENLVPAIVNDVSRPHYIEVNFCRRHIFDDHSISPNHSHSRKFRLVPTPVRTLRGPSPPPNQGLCRHLPRRPTPF